MTGSFRNSCDVFLSERGWVGWDEVGEWGYLTASKSKLIEQNKFKTILKQNKGVFEYHHTEDKSKIIYNPLTHDVQSQRGAGVRPLRVDCLALVLAA